MLFSFFIYIYLCVCVCVCACACARACVCVLNAVKSADTCRRKVNIVHLASLICEYLSVN
jgi:hypothetical protein